METWRFSLYLISLWADCSGGSLDWYSTRMQATERGRAPSPGGSLPSSPARVIWISHLDEIRLDLKTCMCPWTVNLIKVFILQVQQYRFYILMHVFFLKRAYIIIFSSLFFWSFTVGFSFTLSYSSCSRGTAAAKSQRVWQRRSGTRKRLIQSGLI